MARLSDETEAGLLESRARLLEAQADDRYDTAIARYGGGSSTFVRAIAVADGYRKEAAQLREQAAALRARAARTTGQPAAGPGTGFEKEEMPWHR